MYRLAMGKFVVERRIVRADGRLDQFVWASGCFHFRVPMCDAFAAQEFCKNNPQIIFADKVFAVGIGPNDGYFRGHWTK